MSFGRLSWEIKRRRRMGDSRWREKTHDLGCEYNEWENKAQ